MKISVDLELCQSNGQCCYAAPEIFDLGEDGTLTFTAEPDGALREAAEDAVLACPVQAISIEG